MVTYDSRNWFRAMAIHRSDTFRKLWPLVLLVGAFTYVVGLLELRSFGPTAEGFVKNLPVMHSLLGFTISMLLVFRTNTAYDRW